MYSNMVKEEFVQPAICSRRYRSQGVKAESLGSRIRRMVRTKVMEPMDGEQIFDDQPNEPSKAMDVNPIYDFHNDTFDLVENMHMSALDASNQAVDKKSPDASAEPKGVSDTPPQEVSDPAS